ncbi:hypothetical protein B0H14DRAFT_3631892 [Mycena olivaceomarginata]|nr:hypothetical protein B0H14DRAFT_3631892 [Mycena olivaceomarginata]
MATTIPSASWRRLEETFNKQIKHMPLHSLPPKDKEERADKVRQLREKPKKPLRSSSKRSSKQMKDLSDLSTKKKGGKPISNNDVLTFEQKKDLSEAVARLDGHQLEKVIKIIQEGFPGIDTSTENIELDTTSSRPWF